MFIVIYKKHNLVFEKSNNKLNLKFYQANYMPNLSVKKPAIF